MLENCLNFFCDYDQAKTAFNVTEKLLKRIVGVLYLFAILLSASLNKIIILQVVQKN